MLVAYMDQIKSGKRNHVSPGARIRWIVTMKFKPVRIDEKPTTNTPSAVGITFMCDDDVLKGCRTSSRYRLRRSTPRTKYSAAPTT